MAARDILKKKIDLLVRNQVSDVLGRRRSERDCCSIFTKPAGGHSNHFFPGQGRPATISRVEGCVYLNVQSKFAGIVGTETDARDDPLGHRQVIAAYRIAVDFHARPFEWKV